MHMEIEPTIIRNNRQLVFVKFSFEPFADLPPTYFKQQSVNRREHEIIEL